MAVLYVVAAWLIMQVAGVLIDLGSLPGWVGPSILPLLVIGFPIALIFSWFYEITPEGISLEKDVDRAESITHVTGRRLDFIVIALLSAGLILFAYDKWWIGPPPEKSIAVLAFENMSGDPDQEYFSDGVSDELLNVLAQIPELTVISRSSAFSFKGKDVSIPQIAEQLNVAHVLEGSVRRDGNRIRITAQLIEASSDSHLWSDSYDRDLDDVFGVQEEIATAISDALKLRLKLATGEVVQPTVIKTASTAAYDAYLRGRDLINRGQNAEGAIRHLERSLRLDNSFAPAHALLAIAITYNAPTLEEARREAISHLDRAQELEPDLAEAHGGRAVLARYAGDHESAIEHARAALASNPSYADAMNSLQLALGAVGRFEEMEATIMRMAVADPMNAGTRFNYGWWLGVLGRVEEAHEIADQLLALSPSAGYWAHAQTSGIWQGKIAEALSWALRAEAAYPANRRNAYTMQWFSWIGEYDEARRVNDERKYVVDVAEGRFDEAIDATQGRMQLNPESGRAITAAANVLYAAGRIDEALPLLEHTLDFAPDAFFVVSPIELGIWPHRAMMRLALARRNAGDEEGAQAAARKTRQNREDLHAAMPATFAGNKFSYETEALFAAFDNDPDRAIAALKSAILRGLRDPGLFDDPLFEELWDVPRFTAVREELDAILAAEHDKVLQLICFNNPTPDNWQPLPETCEGVVERHP